jgi:GT2 family glycosyltransferase
LGFEKLGDECVSAALPFVSIIIAFYKNVAYLKDCVSYCEKLDYPNFEIIVVGNTDPILTGEKVKWLKIKEVAQGPKKDVGVANAKGEIVAFVDDDAFPRVDWIKKAVKYFDDPLIGAVCGPGVKPPNESLKENVSSAFWDSPIGSGPARYRYVAATISLEDGEAPGYNLFVRRSLMLSIGGIASKFRSGEDAILSKKIREAGKKIVYAPDVVVYHRRRPFLKPFLRQISTYGVHRGYFLRHVPSASPQGDPIFALPLVNAVLLVGSFVLSFFETPYLQSLCIIFLAVDLSTYLGLSFLSSLWLTRRVSVSVVAMFAIPMAHLTYAIGYLKGLTISKLGEKPSH